uniref:Uncharacterized protein n=1 Tax=Leersia perrieri TaxID=77586 RepID=A0A0D9VS86_9ORYZ
MTNKIREPRVYRSLHAQGRRFANPLLSTASSSFNSPLPKENLIVVLRRRGWLGRSGRRDHGVRRESYKKGYGSGKKWDGGPGGGGPGGGGGGGGGPRAK